MSRGMPDLRRVLRALRQHPNVEVVSGSRHRKVYVDGSLVTVLSRGRSADNDLRASVRALRRSGVDL